MSERITESYLQKAVESLIGAESEYTNGRYNNCANRSSYACFQAAIVALLREGIQPRNDQWAHTFVQSRFVGEVVNRLHRYAPAMRSTLTDLIVLRLRADYRTDAVTQIEALGGLRRGRDFVEAVVQGGDVGDDEA